MYLTKHIYLLNVHSIRLLFKLDVHSIFMQMFTTLCDGMCKTKNRSLTIVIYGSTLNHNSPLCVQVPEENEWDLYRRNLRVKLGNCPAKAKRPADLDIMEANVGLAITASYVLCPVKAKVPCQGCLGGIKDFSAYGRNLEDLLKQQKEGVIEHSRRPHSPSTTYLQRKLRNT